jgi:aldehyde dehydrogenase (NAD+)
MTTTHAPAHHAPGTDLTAVADTVRRIRAAADSGRCRPLEWRRGQLKAMIAMLEDNEERLIAALREDLGKPVAEAFITDLAFTTGEIKMMLKNLKKWTKPRRVGTPLVSLPGSSRLVPEPLGAVLVIAPWNYPVQLLIGPAAGAVAAGNAVVMKPSEVSAATSAVLADLVPRYLDTDAIALVEGAVAETTELLRHRFDHVFYTGNGKVGRIVMEAAAKHLTPVTLELGGKSPTIVTASANIEVAARRIAWGKWLNAGQTCIAPDYVLVEDSVHDRFVDAIGSALRSFYGDDPRSSASYGRIVSPRHFGRLRGLMAGGRPAIGGQTDEAERYIAPTVLVEVDRESELMQEEIFGPILPVLPISGVDEAIAFVRSKSHPLAMYVFSESRAEVDRVLASTSAGGVTVNGTILHISNPNLPFGGVGESGMGAYHGRASVELFQHAKPVLRRGTRIDPSLPYPPYTDKKLRLFRKVL